MRDVSGAAGLGPNYLSQIFRNGTDPTLGSLAAVADELDISVSDLIGPMQLRVLPSKKKAAHPKVPAKEINT